MRMRGAVGTTHFLSTYYLLHATFLYASIKYMYTTKDFSNLLGLTGFSETLLNNHFNLYAGYVTNTNKLIDLLKTKEVGTPEYAELHRRFGWEWNGMRLHELYFENLSKEGSRIPPELMSSIEKSGLAG